MEAGEMNDPAASSDFNPRRSAKTSWRAGRLIAADRVAESAADERLLAAVARLRL
jgi:hypothetical protein